MEETSTGTRKTFHEAVVDVINRCTSPKELIVLGRLLRETKIPKNHDAIITAWREAVRFVGWNDQSGVIDDLLQQKQEAEAEAAEKAKQKKDNS